MSLSPDEIKQARELAEELSKHPYAWNEPSEIRLARYAQHLEAENAELKTKLEMATADELTKSTMRRFFSLEPHAKDFILREMERLNGAKRT